LNKKIRKKEKKILTNIFYGLGLLVVGVCTVFYFCNVTVTIKTSEEAVGILFFLIVFVLVGFILCVTGALLLARGLLSLKKRILRKDKLEVVKMKKKKISREEVASIALFILLEIAITTGTAACIAITFHL
jgi:hypothetical protein